MLLRDAKEDLNKKWIYSLLLEQKNEPQKDIKYL